MSEELKKEMNEEITDDNPTYVEPSKDINIGSLDITLCNELIQEINNTLNVTFICVSEIEAIQDAFLCSFASRVLVLSFPSTNVQDQLTLQSIDSLAYCVHWLIQISNSNHRIYIQDIHLQDRYDARSLLLPSSHTTS